MKNRNIILTTIFLTLVSFALAQRTQAVSPAPDGGYPGQNTAEGQNALSSLTTGGFNTANGWLSLRAVTTASFNTAVGAGTLLANTGDENTATGAGALLSNTSGIQNTAGGAFTVFSNTTGNFNTAEGSTALLSNTIGSGNIAIGVATLEANTTGDNNTAVGTQAGFNQTTGNYNVYIGSGMFGVAGESNACYIASIFGQTSANGMPVFINSDNKLGTTTSSKRFKEAIKPMDKASETVFALKPVRFRYRKEIDPAGKAQFGLVAEDVEKVNPDLIVRDKEGKPYTVRYEAVNAMLLNEFLKEHQKVQELGKQVEKLTAGLRKVSAQLEATKPAPRVVNNP